MPAKKSENSESRLILISSLVCIFLGIGLQIGSPFLDMWFKIEYPDVPLGLFPPLATGWVISLIGLIMLAIYKDTIPNTVAAIKGSWKSK